MLNLSFNKQPSIIRVFSIYIAISLFIVSAISYYISYKIALTNAHFELQQETKQQFNEIMEVIKIPLWNFDSREIQIIGNTFFASDLVDSLRIENSNHEIVFNSNKNPSSGLSFFKSKIEYYDTVVGHIYYTVSQKRLDALKSRFLWTYFVNTVLIVFGVLFVVGFFLRSVLINAFKGFSKSVNKFSAGEEGIFREKVTYSEFSPLIYALHKMAADRIQAETSTVEAVKLRENILAASPIGIAVYDKHGQCISANESFCRIIGATKEQALAQNYHHIESWRRTDVYKTAVRAVRTKILQQLEVQVTTTFGMSISLDCKFTPISTKGEEHLLLMVSDITKRKAEEIELESYRHKLEERVEERTNELRNTQNELVRRERLAILGQLTGGIAHDFNNILAVISGFNELLFDAAERNDELESIEYSKEINNATERAATLISQLLTFSRGAKTESSRLDIGPTVKEMLNLLLKTIPSSIRFDTHFEENLPAIYANPIQIHQVLMNLCINARDAISSKGNIKLSAITDNIDNAVCSSCHCSITGRFVELLVEDDGNGIPENNIPYIFDPFFSTKEVGKGTGMGLSVVHGIVHNYGGHILVQSSPDGSCFKLLFPVADHEPE
ncbi:MAG: ATP-binding protein [Candidatus Heimdallarchaeota archaeon]|nr:ATP-binding protein [Candidatus Heimdallarchaeota archaeon]